LDLVKASENLGIKDDRQRGFFSDGKKGCDYSHEVMKLKDQGFRTAFQKSINELSNNHQHSGVTAFRL